jgi:hypothetical protein
VLLIYTNHITQRFQYITHTLLGNNILLTDSKEALLVHVDLKINYSTERLDDDALWINPSGLLVETGISKQYIDCFEWNKLKVFFKTEGDIPFDIFAASFYLITRYEEYLPHQSDEYGRYAHTSSLAYKENFLQLPLVNLWLKELETVLLQRDLKGKSEKANTRPFTFLHSTFTYIPTYDIDIAFSYLHQPLWKNVLGFYRDLLKGDLDKVVERASVYSGRQKDPFDEFDWLDNLHQQYNLQPVYFFLTILKRGQYDKNIAASSKALQQLYRSLSLKYTTGLHPSWQSGTEEWLLQQETETLQKIIQRPVQLSRNHYLRFTLPHTYRRLIEAGICHDYSMAYGSINGFRASYTLPYQWFDLEKETITKLIVHPFCFMEASSYFEQKYAAEQAAEEIQYYHDIVKSVNGEFITLFHNHFLTQQPQWLLWRNMYEAFLKNNFG